MASEDGETYLRLMAETELRRALTQPKVHRPRRRDRLIRFASRWLGLRLHRGRIRRLRRSTAAFSSSTMRARRARRYANRTISAWRRQQHGGAYDGLRRLAAAANALVTVGAVDEQVADAIVADHEAALALRQRIFPGSVRMMPARPAGSPPGGPFGVVSIGARTAIELSGGQAEITLLGLLIGPDRAVLTIAARQPANADYDAAEFLMPARGVDNQGGSYRAGFSGGGSDEEWIGQLTLHPALRPGLRWLDMTFRPGTAPIRIKLDQARPPEAVAIEPLPQAGIAGRYIDTVAERLFASEPRHRPDLGEDVATFLGAGVITPDSPAIARLVTLSRRLDASVPPSLADVPDTELPEKWENVLASGTVQDGPTGIVGATAVLPELDGTRWAIAGLRSKPRSAELHVLGWGRQRHNRHYHAWMPGNFSWWVRDSAGRWHASSMSSGSWGDDHADLTLELRPALHPEATSIDVIVTGTSGRVLVTLPLEWAGT
jgi:hypothetical protein